MKDRKLTCLTLVVKTIVVQTVTYFVVGFLAFLLLDYHRRYAEPPMNAFMRQTDAPWVMAGPLFQPIRGLLFALAFYPLRGILFGKAKGWLVLWLELTVLGIFSPFGPSPGSVEGMIYTIWPLELHAIGLPEVLLQSLALSVILHYWVNRPEQRWISWVLGVAFVLVLMFPVLGLSREDGSIDERKTRSP
jgi:hypothetical protein